MVEQEACRRDTLLTRLLIRHKFVPVPARPTKRNPSGCSAVPLGPRMSRFRASTIPPGPLFPSANSSRSKFVSDLLPSFLTLKTLSRLTRAVGCFSVALGFPENHLSDAMDVEAPDSLTQMRMIHYMASENASGTWRAGKHTDIGCLTLLFQRDGEDGLEVCPGRESHNDHAIGDDFSPLPAVTGPIVVNIGDMLSNYPRSEDFFSPGTKKSLTGSPA